jgi:formylglycine-generating enzyme required for sulfatase activity
VFGAVLLTTFSIDATDTLRGSQTALSIIAGQFSAENCPVDMVLVQGTAGDFCIDKYEVSVDDKCIIFEPKSTSDTAHNLADTKCKALSVAGEMPWTHVAQPQAVQLCAKEGKRLPTAIEWYEAVSGTPDNINVCNLNGEIMATGASAGCVSGAGANDLVGNVWEFTSSEVVDGLFENKSLPEEGYVEQVGADGLATVTSINPNNIYNQDYFWSKAEGRFSIIRGGFYGSRLDGGIYAVHAANDINFASAAIGFRCVKSLN